MIGIISYVHGPRKFALITPEGKGRDHDVFVHAINFFVANLDTPFIGQRIDFDVALTVDGKLEARNIRIATPSSGMKLVTNGGASPATALNPRVVAGNSSGAR